MCWCPEDEAHKRAVERERRIRGPQTGTTACKRTLIEELLLLHRHPRQIWKYASHTGPQSRKPANQNKNKFHKMERLKTQHRHSLRSLRRIPQSEASVIIVPWYCQIPHSEGKVNYQINTHTLSSARCNFVGRGTIDWPV